MRCRRTCSIGRVSSSAGVDIIMLTLVRQPVKAFRGIAREEDGGVHGDSATSPPKMLRILIPYNSEAGLYSRCSTFLQQKKLC